MSTGPNLIAISIGNTRTHIGRFEEGVLKESERLPNQDLAATVQQITTWWSQISGSTAASIAVATVNEKVSSGLIPAVEDQLSIDVYRVDEDFPIPIGTQLDPETITGVDRLLNAAAAYENVKQACIIIDAGTAITVDFVDGEGTFHGGAIAPGGRIQLKALHDYADALPGLDFSRPDQDPFGRSTAQAMLKGVYHGIRGMIWRLVEIYAEHYGAYPMVIATGGDAELLLQDDEGVDRVVPARTLMGIAAAARRALSTDDADVKQ